MAEKKVSFHTIQLAPDLVSDLESEDSFLERTFRSFRRVSYDVNKPRFEPHLTDMA